MCRLKVWNVKESTQMLSLYCLDGWVVIPCQSKLSHFLLIAVILFYKLSRFLIIASHILTLFTSRPKHLMLTCWSLNGCWLFWWEIASTWRWFCAMRGEGAGRKQVSQRVPKWELNPGPLSAVVTSKYQLLHYWVPLGVHFIISWSFIDINVLCPSRRPWTCWCSVEI